MVLLQIGLQGALILILNAHCTKRGRDEQITIHFLAAKKFDGPAFKY